MSPAWSGRLALLANAALVLIAAWLLVRIFWLAVGGVEVRSGEAIPVPRIAPTSTSSGEFRWALFGRPTAAPVTLRPTPVADTRLRLKGVVAGMNGYAIIADPSQGEQVYRAGDPLPGGGEVESIESRRVIIVRDGQREALVLDPDASVARQSSPATSARRQADAETAPEMPGIRGRSRPAAGAGSLAGAARGFGLDADRLANSISAMPVSGGGFRVRPGRNARLFRELGLQVNDIVLSVNGQPLESTAAVQRLFSDIMSRGEVAITVRRDGREITLRPDLQQIMGSLQSQ
jgi:general secretion pathway protein C